MRATGGGVVRLEAADWRRGSAATCVAPHHPAEIVAAGSKDAVPQAIETGLFEQGQPLPAGQESGPVPPPVERAEKEVERPRGSVRRRRVRTLGEYQDAVFGEHRAQPGQTRPLVSGTVQSVGTHDRGELAEPLRRRLVEVEGHAPTWPSSPS